MPPSASLLALLEYRLRSVAIGHIALRLAMNWDEVPSMAVSFNDQEVFEGTATGFTNGAIEAAIVHSRAILEFMGLAGKDSTTLRESTARKKGDHGIELIDGLRPVTISDAINAYPGPATEAQAALAYVIYLANKGLAHTTSSFSKHDEGSRLLEIAFRGAPTLLCNRFYIPQDIEPPAYHVQGRKRAA